MKKYLLPSDWTCGFSVGIGLIGFQQDWMGKTDYTDWANTHWIEMSPFWWLIFISIGITIPIWRHLNGKQFKNNRHDSKIKTKS